MSVPHDIKAVKQKGESKQRP